MDKDPSFDKWGTTSDHLRQRNAISTARTARAMERQEIQKAQADLLQEDYRIGHPEQLGYRVTVSLEQPANARGLLSVELTYITKKAQWML